jgi:outer membrane protein TolC
LNVLNAESQVAQARSQHVAARQEAFTALATLAHATGLLEKGGSERAAHVFSNPIEKDKRP